MRGENYSMMFDELDPFNEEEVDELRLQKLLDKVCEGVVVPSDDEVEEALDWQSS